LLRRLHAIRTRWQNLSLAQQFAIAGTLYTLPAMLLCSVLTTTILTQAMVERHAHALSVVITNAMAERELNAGSHTPQLDLFQHLAARPEFLAEFPYLTVWKSNGEVYFSNLSHERLAPDQLPAGVKRAFSGETLADFTNMDSVEFQRTGLSQDFLEIYFPITDRMTGAVQAAVQLREATRPLEQVLLWVTVSTWAAVGLTSASVVTGLYGLVRRGSLTIQRQQQSLQKRLRQSQALARRYRQLKEEAQRLSGSVTRLTDEHLRNIGTDLHDGPAQTIALAVLNIELARRAEDQKVRLAMLEKIETALGEALHDMRSIASGLVLPELEKFDIAEIIEHAVELHVRRTGLSVATAVEVPNWHAPQAIGVCLFRFVQEGLNNAFHHGVADGLKVAASFHGRILKVSVNNRYEDGSASAHAKGDHGLGLHGLRARVQSVGGNFLFVQEHGHARIEMWLDTRKLGT
jgi:Signal transduction histidine kinase